jgi:uracil-DNA glycosylase
LLTKNNTDQFRQLVSNIEISSPAKNLPQEESPQIIEEIKDLETLFRSISNCQKCRLGITRNKIVFGEGDINAKLMFIGEGPGQDEDISGRPFVGKAGILLTRIIENGLKIPRNSVYIANIVKCRPPGNRDPLPDEADCCIGVLKKQIEIINPSVIVLLGRVAAKYLLNIEDSITKARESSYNYNDKTVFITYHPSALLRNEKYKRPVWEDMKKVIKALGLKSKDQ